MKRVLASRLSAGTRGLTWCVGLAASVVALASGCGTTAPADETDDGVQDTFGGNRAPRIESLVASPDVLQVGDSAQVVCSATDADGDSLNYTWTASGGSAAGSGPSATWLAPQTPGGYTVTCTVSDSRGGSDSQIVSLTVQAEPFEPPV